MPELLDPERRLLDRGQFDSQFLTRHADQIAPSVRQRRAGRIEFRRMGEDLLPFRGGEGKIYFGGHALLIAAYAAEKPFRLNVSVSLTSCGPGERAMARLEDWNATTAAWPLRAKAAR